MATKQRKPSGTKSTTAARGPRKETTAPGQAEVADSGQRKQRTQEREAASGAGRSLWRSLPSGTTLAYFGALGAVGAAGLIEWPVVAAIGVGTAVARRAASTGGGAESQ